MKIAHKIADLEDAVARSADWRNKGLRVVFTNGCFDILHEGHIRYLEEAQGLGDKLIVGLNSDASTRRLKGPNRPINTQDSRAYILASLSVIDLVVLFEEDTPLSLIEKIQPDILVKGGDYTEDGVVGGDFVKEKGGRVVIVPYVEGYSTTSIEEKIRAMKHGGSTD